MIKLVSRGGDFPDWCELKSFSVHDLSAGSEMRATVSHPKARLLATAGSFQLKQAGRSQVLREQQFMPLEPGEYSLSASGPAQAMLLEGSWGEELGGCGTFRAENVANPSDRGDKVDYQKRTNVDAHYHDCDEYWLILEGRATCVVDGEHVAVKPGDCLLIPMGALHDMPDAPEPVKAVYFESSLRGQKRIGHLWQHTHGPTRSSRR